MFELRFYGLGLGRVLKTWLYKNLIFFSFFFFKYFLKPRLKIAAIGIPRATFSINPATTIYLSCVLYKQSLKHVYSCVCLNMAIGLV